MDTPKTKPTYIDLYVDLTDDGRESYETVTAEMLSADTYRLVHAPMILPGIAAGDVFRVASAGRFTVIQRSGNLTIQVLFPRPIHRREIKEIDRLARSIGGTFDGHARTIAAISVPIAVGYDRIQSALDSYCHGHNGARWWFANVFDDDGNPLSWVAEYR